MWSGVHLLPFPGQFNDCVLPRDPLCPLIDCTVRSRVYVHLHKRFVKRHVLFV